MQIYIDRFKSIYNNIQKKKSDIIKRLKKGEFLAHELANMTHQEMDPPRWKEIIDMKIRKPYTISESEKNRIRGLHLAESKDKRISSLLTEKNGYELKPKCVHVNFDRGGKIIPIEIEEDIVDLLKRLVLTIKLYVVPLVVEDQLRNPL